MKVQTLNSQRHMVDLVNVLHDSSNISANGYTVDKDNNK
jgi:hypothetical protein